MITLKGKLIRINPTKTTQLQFSSNDGRTWNTRYAGPSAGEFSSLMDNGKEILANTSKGLYYSSNECRTWNKRK